MTSTLTIDAAELPAASVWPDIARELDGDDVRIENLFAKHMEKFEPIVDHRACTLAMWILDTIEAAPTAAIGVVCVNILLNRRPHIETSLGEWAKILGTTKKTLDLFLVTQGTKLSLKPSGISKNQKARVNFSKSQKYWNSPERVADGKRKRSRDPLSYENRLKRAANQGADGGDKEASP